MKECTPPSSPTDTEVQLTRILQQILTANPTITEGGLNPSRLCITEGSRGAGNADPDTGMIQIGTPLLLLLRSEAEVAAAVAHELAHISMQHGRPGTFAPALERSSEYISVVNKRTELAGTIDSLKTKRRLLLGKIRQLEEAGDSTAKATETRGEIEKISGQLSTMEPEYDALFTRENRLEKELLPQERAKIWAELEADETGYELYLRTGFEPAGFPRVFDYLMSSEEKAACDKIFSDLASGGTTLPKMSQGEINRHPTWCWRKYNLIHLESHLHSAEYKALSTSTAKAEP